MRKNDEEEDKGMKMMMGDLKSYPTVQIVFDVFKITFLQEINFTQMKINRQHELTYLFALVFVFLPHIVEFGACIDFTSSINDL